MKCSMIENRLDEYDSGDLSSELSELMDGHIKGCADCQELVEEHRRYRQLMSGFEAPEAAPGQMARLLRHATIEGQRSELHRHGRQSFVKGFAMASSIALAVVLAWQALLPSPLPGIEQTDLTAVAIEPVQATEITVVINVPANMTGANLALSLPEGIRLEGLEEYASVAWPVDLDKGANVLTLPVTVSGAEPLPEQLYIAATIEYQDKVKVFQLPVQLTVGDAASPELGLYSNSISSNRYHI